MTSATRDSKDERAAEWVFGAVLCAVAGVAWVFARGEGGVRLSPGDVGPWFVPRAMAAIVGLCGIIDLIVSMRAGRRAASESRPTTRLEAGDWLTVGAIIVYASVIPIVGFSLTTIVASPLLMYRQGLQWRWWWTILLSITFILFVKWLFGSVFGVMIPEGMMDRYW